MPGVDSRPSRELYVVLVLLTAGSAVLGFIRETKIAQFFGAASSTDAYYAALAIPFGAAYFLVGGALSPPLTSSIAALLEKRNQEGARRLLSRMLRNVLLTGGLLALAIAAFARPVARILSPGFSEETLLMMARLLPILLAYGVLTSAALVGTAALTAAGAYRTPVVALFLGNLVSISLIAAFHGRLGIFSAAWGMTAGSVVTLAGVLAGLRNARLLGPAEESIPLVSFPWFEIGTLTVALAAAYGIDLAEKNFASSAAPGSVAILSWGGKLIHLPMRLIAAPLASVAFPRLVRGRTRADTGSNREAGETASWTIRILAYSAVVTAAAAAPIVAITFGHGRLDESSSKLLASVLMTLAPAVVALGIVEIASKYLLAAGRARQVAVAQLAALGVYIGAAAILRPLGAPGLAAARDAAWCTAAIGLAYPLVRHEKLPLFPEWRRTLIAVVAAAASSVAALSLAPGGPFVCATAAAAAAAASYFAILRHGRPVPPETAPADQGAKTSDRP